MNKDELEFNKHKERVILFKNELKQLVKKHNITIETTCEYLTVDDDCNGVGTDINYIVIDGKKWYNHSLNEIIEECFKME